MIIISYSDRMKDMNGEDRDALSQSADRWGRHPLLSDAEVVALAQAKDAGSVEARNTLVEHNMQLVIRIARGWCGRGVPFEDLVQEGAIGLMRAADLYDWTLGHRFSTFAGLRIVAACQRAIENQGDLIRIPVHTRSSGMCKPEVERAKHVVSGNTTIGMGGTGNTRGTAAAQTLFDIIPDKNQSTEDDALAAVASLEAAGAVATALLCLNPQERAVIEARYLAGVYEPITMAVVARGLGISKQRVEQVQKTAFEKLRTALQGVEN